MTTSTNRGNAVPESLDEPPALVELQGHVMIVTLNRPKALNAVNAAMTAAVADAVEQADNDPEIRALVITGSGQRAFCAGADLKAVGGPDGNRAEPDGDGPMGPTRLRLSKPVIAAISGFAVAGGLELALWCDLRVAEESAVLGVFCRRWGVPLIDGGTVRLPQIIGLGRALDLILTGRGVPAAEAAQLGLVSRVVPDGGARAAAEQLAREISAFPQACLRNDRLSALESSGLETAAAMANEFRRGMATLAAPEITDGVARFQAGAGRGGTFS